MNIGEVYKYLNDFNLYPDDIMEYHDDLNDKDYLVVSIRWGDWKHEHLRCEYIMYDLGFICDYKITTEEDGSDCYSADHYYIKEENL